MERRIRVLVVDDSAFFRQALAGHLNREPGFEVVGTAANPFEARDLILRTQPEVMSMDIEMPRMNGVEFLRILMPQWAIPVVIVSSAQAAADDCRRAGAADFVAKPSAYQGNTLKEFFFKVGSSLEKAVQGSTRPLSAPPPALHRESGYRFAGVVAMGASTGGTKSTAQILKALPKDFPGVVIVQHMPNEFTRMYADTIDRECAMTIREARGGEMVEPGLVLIAPGGRHMELTRAAYDGYTVRLRADEKVNGHRPSVDVLFSSVARVAGRDAVGVILTGMGADGARGLLEMRRRGAFTVGQDEKTSVVYGMPKEAYDLGAVTRQYPLDQIAPALLRYAKQLLT